MKEKNKSHHHDSDDGFKLLGILLSVVFLVFIGACGLRSSGNCKAALHASDNFYKEENDKKLSEEVEQPGKEIREENNEQI